MARSTKDRLAARLRSFSDDRGSTLVFVASAMIPLMAFVGVGVDLGRAYMVSSRLQSAVDAAALAAVRTEQVHPGAGSAPGPRTQGTIDALIAANVAPGYMGITRRWTDFTVKRSGEEITVALTGNALVPTIVMKMFGVDMVPVRTTATAVAGRTLPTAVEALLVLDNTGSMDSNGGMVALRQSVNDFLDVVYGEKETRENFAIGMLPYATFVNVGRLLPSTMIEPLPGYTDRPASDPYGWKGCVFADRTRRDLSSNTGVIDSNTFDMGKTLPGEGGMAKISPSIYPPLQVRSFHRQDNRYRIGATAQDGLTIANYAPMRTALVRQYGSNICVAGATRQPVDCSTPGAMVDPSLIEGYDKWPSAKLYRSDVRQSDAHGVVVSSPNYVCPSEALPVSYSHTKSRLRDYVAQQNQPIFNIGTWHNVAMTWGYRLMAREDVFKRARPSQLGLRRVVVFMTDGNFDSVDDGSTVTNRPAGMNAFQRDTAYTAYLSYADKLLVNQDWSKGNSGTASARAAHRDRVALRFAKTCQAMKQEGIEIYTIAFAIAEGDEAEMARQLFRACASDPNTHFFETNDAGELRTAFTTIGAELVDLHLVK